MAWFSSFHSILAGAILVPLGYGIYHYRKNIVFREKNEEKNEKMTTAPIQEIQEPQMKYPENVKSPYNILRITSGLGRF